MSEAASVSEAIGSAGTGCGSCTGSGGAGGRPAFGPLDGGGGVGRATGGFFLAHAPTASSTSSTATTTSRLYIIVSDLPLPATARNRNPNLRTCKTLKPD